MPTTETSQTTLITTSGTADSAEKYGCPGVHGVTGRTDKFVITRNIDDDLTVRAALEAHVETGEHVGSLPPWVPCQLMDLPTLERFMDDHLHRSGDSVFRYESLPEFNVASDPNWRRWRDGADEPDWGVKHAWTDELAAHAEAGIRHYRVRSFGSTLSEHEVYECHWGYALNTIAGEDIRVLREGEHEIPAGLLNIEYWVVNDRIALPVLYDGSGGFVGTGWLGPDESTRFLADRDRAWASAEPFTQWWDRHPELHRSNRQVA